MTCKSHFEAPCVAEQVEVHVDCDTDMAMVSWNSSVGAESYSAVATAADGQRTSCEATGNFCWLAELPCGQVYSLVFTAINEQCQTQSPDTVAFSTRESRWTTMWSHGHHAHGHVRPNVGTSLHCRTRVKPPKTYVTLSVTLSDLCSALLFRANIVSG